jgi:hypothetical protein
MQDYQGESGMQDNKERVRNLNAYRLEYTFPFSFTSVKVALVVAPQRCLMSATTPFVLSTSNITSSISRVIPKVTHSFRPVSLV